MPTYQQTPVTESGLPESTGVLLVNLGTPEAPTATSVRRFLRQFLSDPRVVDYPRVPWWLVLNLVILQIRPARSAAAYRRIWTDAGSPLLVNSRQLATKLQQRLTVKIAVELAMTYGEPSIDAAIDALLEKGVRRILMLPLYPQFSCTTTAAAFDAVSRKLSNLHWVPDVRKLGDYHDNPGYIRALANSVRAFRADRGTGEKLMISFHGVPASTIDGGDPYFRQCRETAALLAHELRLADDDWLLTFQSRVGRAEWLRPYTDETVAKLGEAGLKRLDVLCPGFAADCLETLEEIAMENAALFTEAGGGELCYIPALNARKDHVEALASLIEYQLAAWNSAPGLDDLPVVAGASA